MDNKSIKNRNKTYKDITHTLPISKRLKYRKRNMRVTKDDWDTTRIYKGNKPIRDTYANKEVHTKGLSNPGDFDEVTSRFFNEK